MTKMMIRNADGSFAAASAAAAVVEDTHDDQGGKEDELLSGLTLRRLH